MVHYFSFLPTLVCSIFGKDRFDSYQGQNRKQTLFFKMSPNFAEFLLDTTNNGNEILAVLDDIVEVVETGGTDL